MIMFIGGLKAIPAHLYEAAKMDGANSWQMFWNVHLADAFPDYLYGYDPDDHRILSGI